MLFFSTAFIRQKLNAHDSDVKHWRPKLTESQMKSVVVSDKVCSFKIRSSDSDSSSSADDSSSSSDEDSSNLIPSTSEESSSDKE